MALATTLALRPHGMTRCWISEQGKGMGLQVSIETSFHSTRLEWLGEWMSVFRGRCTVAMWRTTFTLVGEA